MPSSDFEKKCKIIRSMWPHQCHSNALPGPVQYLASLDRLPSDSYPLTVGKPLYYPASYVNRASDIYCPKLSATASVLRAYTQENWMKTRPSFSLVQLGEAQRLERLDRENTSACAQHVVDLESKKNNVHDCHVHIPPLGNVCCSLQPSGDAVRAKTPRDPNLDAKVRSK
jgi:hypothetical protein